MDVDGTNNPKIPAGEIHSTKTFSPKIQLDLSKAEQVLSLFLSSSKEHRQSSKDRQKAFSPLSKINH